jgi:hypothetical protein
MPIQPVRSLVESPGAGMCRCSCAPFAKPSYSWAIRSIIPCFRLVHFSAGGLWVDRHRTTAAIPRTTAGVINPV